MRLAVPLLALAWIVPTAARGARRLAIEAPAEEETAVLRAFGWADRTRSARLALAPAVERARLDVAATLRRAERAFADTHLDEARRAAATAASMSEELALADPDAGAPWLRAELLLATIELAAGDTRAAARALGAVAVTAPGLKLDAGEHPPGVRRAFAEARERVASRAAPRRTIESDPPGADVELNGRLVGRTPMELEAPPERCRLVVRRAGRKPAAADCARGKDTMTLSLPAGDPADRRAELALRQRADAGWRTDEGVVRVLLDELDADWLVSLEPAPQARFVVRAYFRLGRRWVELPSAPGSLEEVAQRVREVVETTEGLAVHVLDTPRGAELEARAGDPTAIARATVHVRSGGEPAFRARPLATVAAGVFRGVLAERTSAAGAVAYHVVGTDARGEVRSRVGSERAPLSYAMTGSGAVVTDRPMWTRWWFWTAVGVVVAGGVTAFALTRSDSVTAVY